MKKLCMLLLLASSLGKLCAQETKTNSDKTFDQPDHFTGRHFYVDIGNKNQMLVNVNDLEDLSEFRNMDSLLYAFLRDMRLLKDSLGNELTVRRIDYNMDDSAYRRLRIIKYPSKGSAFLIKEGEVSSVKTEQDSIIFFGRVEYDAKYPLRKAFRTTRYYKVSLIVNNIDDLTKYMNGSLSQKIAVIRANANKKWESAGTGKMRMKADRSITANSNKGYASGGDFITLGNLNANIQNYKNYFVPSVTAGIKFTIGSKNFKREIGLYWEPNFMFSRNAQNRLETFRNDFLVLTLAHGSIKDNDVRKPSPFLASMSVGYLTRRSGDFFDKRTIRFGFGTLKLFEDKTRIEPVIYFTDLLKKVTPGIRLVQSF